MVDGPCTGPEDSIAPALPNRTRPDVARAKVPPDRGPCGQGCRSQLARSCPQPRGVTQASRSRSLPVFSSVGGEPARAGHGAGRQGSRQERRPQRRGTRAAASDLAVERGCSRPEARPHSHSVPRARGATFQSLPSWPRASLAQHPGHPAPPPTSPNTPPPPPPRPLSQGRFSKSHRLPFQSSAPPWEMSGRPADFAPVRRALIACIRPRRWWTPLCAEWAAATETQPPDRVPGDRR